MESASVGPAPSDQAASAPISSLLEPAERSELDLRPVADEWVLVPRLQLTLAAFGPWSVGLELRALNEVVQGVWATSELLLGSRLGVSLAGWRASLCFLPAIGALRERAVVRDAPTTSNEDRAVTRVIVGTEF